MKLYITALCVTGAISLAINSPAENPPEAPTQGSAARTHQEGPRTDEAVLKKGPSAHNRASKLIGMNVQNPQGEKLGDISEVVFDLDDGRVSYLVMSAGRATGTNQKLLAVPLNAFTRASDQTFLILNASRDNINRAEGIRDNWPAVRQPSFGAQPFWQDPTPRNNQNHLNR